MAGRPGLTRVGLAGSAAWLSTALLLGIVPVDVGAAAPSPGKGLTLTNVAYGGGQFVAVGSNGLLATSRDGLRWTERPSPTQYNLRGATWTGSGWVAVGDHGVIVTSPDGATWTSRASGNESGMRAVVAIPGVVVAGGSGGSISRSTDGGATWTSATVGAPDQRWWGGTVVGGRLLVTGSSGDIITSADGVSWLAADWSVPRTGYALEPEPQLWQAAARGDRAVVVGDRGTIAATGPGRDWRAVPSAARLTLRGVADGRGRFVAVGDAGMVIASRDGTRWSRTASPTRLDLRGVAFGGARFVAVGDEGTIITSMDALSWTTVATMASQTVRGVAAGSGRFVAVGGDGRVWRSDVDGTRWRCAAHPVATGLYAVARGSGRFVAVGIGGAVLTSPDGRHWTPRRSGTNVNLHAVAWLGNHFLAGGDGGTLLRSRDGRQWRREGYPAFHSIRAFTWDPASGTTVGTGAGSIAHRRAGGPWQVITPVGQGQFHTGAAFGEGAFVVSGHAGGLLVSPDAAAWSPAASGVERNLDALIRTADGFVTAGAGIALASSDGTTWTPIPWPTARAPRSMARQGSTLIAVGDARTVVRRVGDGPARLGHLPDCARTTG